MSTGRICQHTNQLRRLSSSRAIMRGDQERQRSVCVGKGCLFFDCQKTAIKWVPIHPKCLKCLGAYSPKCFTWNRVRSFYKVSRAIKYIEMQSSGWPRKATWTQTSAEGIDWPPKLYSFLKSFLLILSFPLWLKWKWPSNLRVLP